MYIWENKESPEVGEFIASINLDDQQLIAEAALQYMEHPQLGQSMSDDEVTLMERGVLQLVGPEDDEFLYEDAAGKLQFEVITDRMVLQSVYNILVCCKREKTGIDDVQVAEVLSNLAQDFSYVERQRAIAQYALRVAQSVPRNRQERRKAQSKQAKKSKHLLFG